MPYKHLQTQSLIILLRQIEYNSNYKSLWPYYSVSSWPYIVIIVVKKPTINYYKVQKLLFNGHVISSEGVSINPEKAAAVA